MKVPDGWKKKKPSDNQKVLYSIGESNPYLQNENLLS